MVCNYCFNHEHTLRPEIEKQRKIVEMLCHYGYSKISFVGGEPTLCPWLPELAHICKSNNVTTMLITNGKALTNVDLSAFDWVGLSIDSFNAATNKLIGRTGELDYFEICDYVKNNSCRLKVNTVVSKFNIDENFEQAINAIAPERWKVLQVLTIKGKNDENANGYRISDEEFTDFIRKHASVRAICPEYSHDMLNSYLMIDHCGSFIDNNDGIYRKSKPITEVGVESALSEINFDLDKFYKRNAVYNWRTA